MNKEVFSIDLNADFLGKAKEFYASGKYKEALEMYNKVLEGVSGDANILYDKAGVLMGLGRYKEAIEVFNKILEIDSKNLRALINKGFILYLTSRYQEAVGVFDEALEIDSKNEWAINNRGAALQKLGKHQNNKESDVVWSFLTSKGFWITIAVLFLIWLAYSLGKEENHTLTPQEIRENINICNKWGGQVIYDSNGQYQDCAINGRIE